jgi:hypothetical protein
MTAEQQQKNLSELLEKEADRLERAEGLKTSVQAKEEEGYDGFTGEKIKLLPNPNFSEAKSVGTMLPINMANETVTNLSLYAQEFDFLDFLKEKLGYNSRTKVVQSFASEQVDALVLAIKSFEQGNAFILGDMAGIGKGRVCAGVLRYAYMQGIIPVFFTQKPYLLNDIYRDLRNIDGMGTNAKGQSVAPKPFVLHNEGVIIDRDGNPIPTNQAYKTTYKDGEAIFRFLDSGNPYSINELCKSITEDIERTGKAALPKDFNCVMLPYSVISQGKSPIRRGFLNAISPNTILVFDESHNAASANLNSNILRTGLPLVNASKAVLFSSATYAKTPSVFNLYVVKTSLRTAVPSLDSITDALKVGGENVSEYIASGLVKEGQMIRRERSFGDCKKFTDYVGSLRREDSFGASVYSDLPDDTQRAFYDEAIGYFKQLRDFSKSDLAASAIRVSVYRKSAELGKELANMDAYKTALNASKETEARVKAEFIRTNRNKYLVFYGSDSISRYKATFRENLFLAVKAKFSADRIIECLETPVNYTNVDGTTHTAPQKPIIAMANTGERIFDELRLEEGQEIRNDFSLYIKAIYNKLFVGTFRLRKVDANIFESTSSLDGRGVNYEEINEDFTVDLGDFSDGGAEVTRIQSLLNAYNSELPFSSIDYLRDRIESVERSAVYFASNGAALYGKASSQFYRFAEGTSRKYMLKKDSNGVLRYTKNDRIKSTTKVFRAFNDGAVDVMLINVVASTGGSAQSSPDEGVDIRPRNMFIVQFELDINIEVQKRGRINRTGQVNSPTYTYVISKIPVELRKYLMFRKKLRKLDANTSADQTASAKTSELTDTKGNVIEDIFNHYGFEVFKKDFIELPDNTAYADIFNDLNWRNKNVDSDAEAEQDEINIEHFNAFVRELELYPAQFQMYFFDEMNEKYIQKKAQLIALGEYQEELEAQNYKAALKQRVVVQLNSGTTVFSLPLFLADYFTLESKRALSKDRLEQEINKLAVWQGQAMTPNEFYSKFVADYLAESAKSQNALREQLELATRPNELDYEDADKFERAMFMFEARKNARLLTQREEQNTMKNYLAFFKPRTFVSYEGNVGMFIGYKIKDTGTKFKYTFGNVEFVFCFLSKYPVLHLKLSSNLEELMAIKTVSQANLYSEDSRKKVQDWKPNLYRRQIRRFLSGNILSGIVDASKRKRESKIRNWNLTRFTNIDGSISTAIELKFAEDLPDWTTIQTTGTELSVACGNTNIYDYISQIVESTGDRFELQSGYVRGQNIYPIWNLEGDKICDRAIAIVRRNLRYYADNAQQQRQVIQFEIVQSYVLREIKETRQKVEVARKVGEKMYNNLYHDQEFQEKFKDNLITPNPEKKTINYAFGRTKTKEGVDTTKYNDLKVYIKRYEFQADDRENIMDFLTTLYNKYDVSFNFRSSVAEYFNVEAQGDVPLEQITSNQNVAAFPVGEYQYRFIRKVPESTIQSLPNLIRKTFEGSAGGVVLAQPLPPNQLPSFELKPYKLPNDILVKLTFLVMNDEDKNQFARAVEQMAEIENRDAYDIGEFVRGFISQRFGSVAYFFGDLRVMDYGTIFKEYALKQDLNAIVFNQEEEVIEKKPVKTEVTFDDAERFIIKLWSII